VSIRVHPRPISDKVCCVQFDLPEPFGALLSLLSDCSPPSPFPRCRFAAQRGIEGVAADGEVAISIPAGEKAKPEGWG
jgi:hypothetical protein